MTAIRYIINLAFPFLIVLFSSTCLAQLNPLSVSVRLNGDVIVTANPPLPYLHMGTLSAFNRDSILFTDYGYRSNGDSVLEFTSYPDMRNENVIVFTAQRYRNIEPIDNYHRYRFVGRSDQDFKLQLTEEEMSGHAMHRPFSQNELTLGYAKNEQLKKITLERSTGYPNPKTTRTHWDLFYQDTILQKMTNEQTTISYQYDTKGNLISMKSYTGNLKSINPSYVHMDSLESLYDRKTPNYLLRDFFRSENAEIHELAYFMYVGNKVVKMVSYSVEQGFRKTHIRYDSLNRVVVFREYNSMGGLEMKFTYNAEGKLSQRNERWISDCFDRGCMETELMETYRYNPKGYVSEIIHSVASHYANEKDVPFNKAKKRVITYSDLK